MKYSKSEHQFACDFKLIGWTLQRTYSRDMSQFEEEKEYKLEYKKKVENKRIKSPEKENLQNA